MKINHNFLLSFLIATLFFSTLGNAQQKSLTQAQQAELNAVSLTDYQSFKRSVKPLIEKMGTKTVVGLGEGTHGTAEFYKLRHFITRILIEDYGFNHVAFENDVTEVWQLNAQLEGSNDINGLMKKYLLSLWQNEETKSLLQWIKSYNAKHGRKVSIDGIDYPSQLPDVTLMQELLAKAKIKSFDPALADLSKAATMQDDAWKGMNTKGFKTDWKVLGKLGKQGYLTTDSIAKAFQQLSVGAAVKSDLLLAAENLKQGFEPFYRSISGKGRDSIMAYNAANLVKNANDKVIIWAHNAHLGKAGIFDNAVGGTGGFLLKHFPNQYFVLGTGTATGTFGGTTDARPVNNSIINSYELKKPIDGSWEALLNVAKPANFYFNTTKFNASNEIRPLRFIGYGIESGKSTYDKSNLSDLFDAFMFLKVSHAPTPLK
jgi:erythromycin esterase